MSAELNEDNSILISVEVRLPNKNNSELFSNQELMTLTNHASFAMSCAFGPKAEIRTAVVQKMPDDSIEEEVKKSHLTLVQ